ncbi:hypothetical protein LTR91_020233 [Friedmanniomyces endolithicus]|uniref:Uncharacterized protein n=1 Tax=Friedmanniomyces endolithicus TaxID=329885 RepID=A0AAN6K1A4_9PEZI|nr:hypothetical protein LTR94_014963 [Friedmanniomyces endolithicus]KAK0771586.1 hypothetical protein LTR75_017636 [Friedmanniomyces endolithicus]KAK0783297.1 hypothetical protein LTR38_013075 [Friedmanniomyces endolithicus]KAK0786335.1 hypothetical protein LTR59_010729 [Friedmanniomyces endolithicus]KAK0825552.1 hypothetical protein LTR03_017437 [Friedmanniomyces endolithicus]
MDGKTPTDQRSGLRGNEDEKRGSVGLVGSTPRHHGGERGKEKKARKFRADEDVTQVLGAAAGEIPPPYSSSALGGEDSIAAGGRRDAGGERVGAGVRPPPPHSSAVYPIEHFVEVIGKRNAKIRELETEGKEQKAEIVSLRDQLVDHDQLQRRVEQLEAANARLSRQYNRMKTNMQVEMRAVADARAETLAWEGHLRMSVEMSRMFGGGKIEDGE